MSGQRIAYEKYKKQLETMSEPIMPSELPKIKLDLRKTARYLKDNNINLETLSASEKNAIIELLKDE